MVSTYQPPKMNNWPVSSKKALEWLARCCGTSLGREMKGLLKVCNVWSENNNIKWNWGRM